jgi:hypothetical protein
VSFPCEAVTDGKVCGADATHLYMTPWSRKYLCDADADAMRSAPKGPNVAVPLIKLSEMRLTCDWVGEGDDGTCGKDSGYFLDHPDGYQRPLCDEHDQIGLHPIRLAEPGGGWRYNPLFDPKKVPYKPPPVMPRYLTAPPIASEATPLTKLPEPYHFEPGVTVTAFGRSDLTDEQMGLPPVIESDARLKPPALAYPMPSAIPTSPIPPPIPRELRSVRSALVDVASLILERAKRKVETWR